MRNTILIGVLLLMAVVAVVATIHHKQTPSPRNVDEAAEKMRDLGLHVVVRGSATGSVEPITDDDANRLHFASDWTGKVRAWPDFFDIPDRPDTKTVAWGGVLLSGDPEIVDRLVSTNRP